MKKITTLLYLLVLLLCPLFIVAQQTGTGSFSASDNHEVDSIDLSTLTPTITIPVLSKKGAIPFSYNLELTSYCFVTVVNLSSRLDCTNPVGTPNSISLLGMGAGYNLSVQGLQTCFTYSQFYVADAGPITVLSEGGGGGASGTQHPVGLGNSLDTCTTGQNFTATTTDNSGYTLKATVNSGGSISFQVWGPNGAYTEPHTNGGSGIVPLGVVFNSVTDTFGNKISTSGSVYTDTLNTPAITVSGNSYQWKDTTGTTQSLTVNSQTGLSVDSGFCDATVYDGSGIVLYPTVYDYPDGTSVSIGLEQGVGGVSTTTGRISSVTLRTGATISYSYGAFLSCGVGPLIPSSLTRTTPDGTTTYTLVYNSSNLTTTDTVLDPGKNKTVYTFIASAPSGQTFVTQIQRYQNTGSVSSPVYTLLTTDLYCYDGNTTNCAAPSTPPAYPITQRDIYHTINGMSGSSRVTTTYDSVYGNLTSTSQYDFGASSPTVMTTTTYGSWNGSQCVNVGSSVYNEPCDVVVSDGTHTLAESQYTYSTKGFKTADSQRTTATYWLTTTFTPNTNGTVNTATNTRGLVTTYGYGCNNLLPTTVTNAMLSTAATWDCNGAVVMTTTDANLNGTSTTYDAMFRPLSFTDESGLTTNFSYTSNSVTASSSFSNGLYSTSTISTVDSLGRSVRTQTTDGTSYDTSTLTHGFSGTKWQNGFAVPCLEPLNSDCAITAYKYTDPIGRPINTVDGNGGTTTWSYLGSGNKYDEKVIVGPTPTTTTVQSELDGLGRTKSTCAIETGGGTACGQAMSGSGILTSNAYSFGDETSTVVSTRGSQSRTAVKDAIGRVISTTTPEAGTTTYAYDSYTPGTCGGWTSEPGDLMLRTNNDLSSVCYVFDDLHRLTTTGTSSTTANVCKRFLYDSTSNALQAQPTGYTGTNLKGRVVEAETDNCTAWPPTQATMITDEWFSYDANGRVTDVWESTPHSGGYYHTNETYWLNGAPNSLTGIPGYAAYTVGLNSNGRPYSSMLGTTALVNKVNRDAAGNPGTIGYGSGSDQDVYHYDSTERMKDYTFTAGSKSDGGVLTWNPNGTLGTLVITDGFNAGGSQTCNFTYDDVGRLYTDSCSSGGSTIWNQTDTYDQYDNLTKTGNPGTTWAPGYTSSNQIIGGSYDGNGNVTYDLNNTYTWNVQDYGKMSSVRSGTSPAVCGTSGACITYDASGKPVEKTLNYTYYELLYSPLGLVATMQGATTVFSAQLPMPAGAPMQFSSSGGSTKNVNHADWLGTVRVNIGLSSHTVQVDTAYSPYGEAYDTFGSLTNNETFTGDQQNLFAGLFDTPNRELDQTSGSRWLSPDPAMSGWNLYAYPTNPNSEMDPFGLFAEGEFGQSVDPPPQGVCGNGEPVDCSSDLQQNNTGKPDTQPFEPVKTFVVNVYAQPILISFTNFIKLGRAAGDIVGRFRSFLDPANNKQPHRPAAANNGAPGDACWPGLRSFCGIVFNRMWLNNNRQADQEIFNMTNDPYSWANGGTRGIVFGQINQLEQLNLMIDEVALGELNLSALDNVPGADLPPGILNAADAGIDYFQDMRNGNNAKIDQLLQTLAPPVP